MPHQKHLPDIQMKSEQMLHKHHRQLYCHTVIPVYILFDRGNPGEIHTFCHHIGHGGDHIFIGDQAALPLYHLVCGNTVVFHSHQTVAQETDKKQDHKTIGFQVLPDRPPFSGAAVCHRHNRYSLALTLLI